MRRLLRVGSRLALGSAVGLGAVACGGDPESAPASPSAEFVEPAVLPVTNDTVTGTVEVRYADNNLVINDELTGELKLIPIHTRTFGGTVPGPTIRLAAGQRIDIDIVNALPETHDGHGAHGDVNFPHHLNSLNFHLHGLHVDPTGNADNVLREISPQTQADVIVDVPENHNPGLFWYHPHKHGAAMVQFLSGMSGAIVIEGDIDKVPEIAAAKERLLLIQELGLDDAGEVPEPDPNATLAKDLYHVTQTYFPINGIVNPILRMRPGEVQRLRMLNATRGRFLEVSLEGHVFHQLETDGIALDKVRSLETYEIPAGGRFEALVKAGAAGTYRLTAPLSGPAGTPPKQLALATIVVEGEPMDMALPDDLPQPDGLLPDTRGLTPDDQRKIVFSVDETGLNAFHLDDKLYRPDCYSHILQLGHLVEWTLENTSEDAHPFHIHTNSFQVLEVNGAPLEPPVWHDTVAIPPMGSVKARMRVDDFVGGMVLHCHIINHEDLGMMQNVVLVDDTLPEDKRVIVSGNDPVDPALANPSVPGYYVSENFKACE